MSRVLPVLKPFYYLDHFEEALTGVEERYSGLLGETERDYLRDFRELDRSERALLVRMANRKGYCFSLSKLAYPELGDVKEVVAALEKSRFLASPRSWQFPVVLECLSKSDLLAFLRKSGCLFPGAGGMRKKDLVEHVANELPMKEFFGDENNRRFVVLRRYKTLCFLRFLFFGHSEKNLTAFALRDLGVIKPRSSGSSTGPRFGSREEAFAFFRLGELRRMIGTVPVSSLARFAGSVAVWPDGPTEEVRFRHARCLFDLGKRLEQAGLESDALQVYRQSSEHPCRERSVRLLHRLGEHGKVRGLLDEINREPSNDEELLFAGEFERMKYGKSRKGMLTEVLRSASEIVADESRRDSAEKAAMWHFQREGWECHHVENHFWKVLFGAIFWDELQGGIGSERANEFDDRPVSLLDRSFYRSNKEQIERTLAQVCSGEGGEMVRRVFGEFFGQPNGVFQWRKEDEAVLLRFFETADPEVVGKQLRSMARDTRRHSGFPDLILLGQNEVRFVEVKGEGDQLRRHQLARILHLGRIGFEVSVVRVRWAVDPDQDYVVVDLETTGRTAEHHRITEIGARRVRNGEVVGTFQSLINPERKIPSKITRLTGIDDEMVRDAPTFSEIADRFRAFMDGAVFVAHHVRFDHSFLRAEYLRLGQAFHVPTLCTVVAMRKYYPGLRSYGLGNLCREFGIELADHHRALCDATATVALLNLVNRKRFAEQAEREES